jgi:hypothetical protein
MTCAKRPHTSPARSSRKAAPIKLPLSRKEHEAALDAAAEAGPQPGIPADQLLPPLRHTAEWLAAQAFFCQPEPGSRWADIPVDRIDPRAPWRAEQMGAIGLVQSVHEVGYVVIRGIGPFRGWKATLLYIEGETTVTEHDLVHSKSRRVVRFDDRWAACRAMQPIIDAGGVPPRSRAWEGLDDSHL